MSKGMLEVPVVLAHNCFEEPCQGLGPKTQERFLPRRARKTRTHGPSAVRISRVRDPTAQGGGRTII